MTDELSEAAVRRAAPPRAVDPTGLDAYSPAQMALRVARAGVTKAELAIVPLVMLGLLAGVFIGNALIVMAWTSGLVTTRALLRNWSVVYAANFAGSLGLVALALAAGTLDLGDGAVGATAVAITRAKLALSPLEAFARGVLCNALVCLAVWLSFAARDVAGKVLCIVFPISTFVALGFEHSIANMSVLPLGLAAGADGTLADVVRNLLFVTFGNVVGGAGGVAFVFWAIYLRRASTEPAPKRDIRSA